MPENINLAHITPIFKGGERCEAANYRPISLTSHITKTFERVIRRAIIRHLVLNNLMNDTQHGFTARRSTFTQLIKYYTDILQILEKHQNVDAIYLDFAKAFDKCDHGVILHKLKSLGICGKLGVWIHAFLTKRQQVVCVLGKTSSAEWVLSGVPQGSVLGPLIFSILISDINKGVTLANLLSFADDTKLYRGISSEQDKIYLQGELGTVYTWAKENNQEFNAKKFESITFGFDQKNPGCYTNSQGIAIENKTVVKDLGIMFSSDGTFNVHIASLAAKGKKLSGWILRTFTTRARSPLITLLKSLIIPTVEYCCPLWAPRDQTNIKLLEKVQKYFTKRIEGMYEVHYWDRLKQLRIFSLERRRERYIIIYVWKVLHGLFPDPGFTIESYNETKKEIMLKIQDAPLDRAGQPSVRELKKLKANSIVNYGTLLYRSLPGYLRTTEEHEGKTQTADSFKIRLDKYLHQIPDEPTCPKRQRRAESNSIIAQKQYQLSD